MDELIEKMNAEESELPLDSVPTKNVKKGVAIAALAGVAIMVCASVIYKKNKNKIYERKVKKNIKKLEQKGYVVIPPID